MNEISDGTLIKLSVTRPFYALRANITYKCDVM